MEKEEILPKLGEEFTFTSLLAFQRANQHANQLGLMGVVDHLVPSDGPGGTWKQISGTWLPRDIRTGASVAPDTRPEQSPVAPTAPSAPVASPPDKGPEPDRTPDA